VSDLERAACLVFDAARRSRRSGETLKAALLRVLYTSAPGEVRAALAAGWVRGAAEGGMGSEPAVTAEMAERFF
jgi:hypothetical protein